MSGKWLYTHQGWTHNGVLMRRQPTTSESSMNSPLHSPTYLDNEDAANRRLQQEWYMRYRNLRRASALIGASTVAIDNKIEQAMDLVKSHLMFAVREEVEVLKEQIKELLEKNNQLEYEINILKSSASPETLQKLAQVNQTSQQQQQPPTTSS